MNKFQLAVAKKYGGGDYSTMFNCNTKTADAAKEVGDTLFAFLMIELSAKEACNSKAEALARINSAINDLETARNAIASTQG